MRRLLAVAWLAAMPLLWIAAAQKPASDDDPSFRKRDQTEEILKRDYEDSLKDSAQLYKLAEELKIELEKNNRHVLSIAAIKKTEEIEKLAKRIRDRIRRF